MQPKSQDLYLVADDLEQDVLALQKAEIQVTAGRLVCA